MSARNICWPNPDATCLQGGCIHCTDGPKISEESIAEYARNLSELPNRCGGETTDAWLAYLEGLTRIDPVYYKKHRDAFDSLPDNIR